MFQEPLVDGAITVGKELAGMSLMTPAPAPSQFAAC